MEIKSEYIPMMKDVFRALPQTLFIKDTEGKYVFTTKVCDLVNGGADNAIIGKTDCEIQYDKELGKRYYSEDLEIAEKGISTHTIDVVCAAGERHFIEVIKNPIYNDEKEIIGIIGICNDLTELMLAREKYEQLGLHDSLTGLYNRNYIVKFNFDNEKSLPCSYILCDCNNLKMVNDVYGHSAGDKYLSETARILKEKAPEESVVIRWGGDEFVIVTPACSQEKHEALIDSIRDEQKKFSEIDPDAGISVGGVLRTQLTVSENEVFRMADRRMYEDKIFQKKKKLKSDKTEEMSDGETKMRIAICDDESQICEVLRDKIRKYYAENNQKVSIQIFDSGEKTLKSDLNRIDVLFLDVDMPGMNGLDTAKAIREQNRDMIIVFLTAYSEFVFESFKVNAFRYLVKPLKNKELTETLDAIMERQCEPEDYLNFQFQNETYSIKYADIIYMEGMRDKIWIYCKDGTYRWRGTFKNIMNVLKDKGFFQIHRSYIINMNKIRKYNSESVLLEGEYEVPISKYRRDEFKEEYIKLWSKIL